MKKRSRQLWLASAAVITLCGLGASGYAQSSWWENPPPPKLRNPRLKAVYLTEPIGALGHAEPTEETVDQWFNTVMGAEVRRLPKQPAFTTLEVLKRRRGDRAAHKVRVGTGEVMPAAERELLLRHPGLLEEDAPIFWADPGARSMATFQIAVSQLAQLPNIGEVPERVDLRSGMPPIRDQGDRGTCVLFAAAGVMDHLYSQRSRLPIKRASPQFMYWLYNTLILARVDDANIRADLWNTDEGTYPSLFHTVLHRDGNRDTQGSAPYVPPRQGYLSEQEAPYRSDQPSRPASIDLLTVSREHLGAVADKIDRNSRFTSQGAYFFAVKKDLESFKAALAGGQPIAIGYPCVMKDWRSPSAASNYVIPDMTADQADRAGGHRVVIVGYEDDSAAPGGGWFIIRNSWGNDWGDSGHARISYQMTMRYSHAGHIAEAYDQPFNARYYMQILPDAPPPDIDDPPIPEATPTPEPIEPTPEPVIEVTPTPDLPPSPYIPVIPTARPTPVIRPTARPTARPTPRPRPTPTRDQGLFDDMDRARRPR